MQSGICHGVGHWILQKNTFAGLHFIGKTKEIGSCCDLSIASIGFWDSRIYFFGILFTLVWTLKLLLYSAVGRHSSSSIVEQYFDWMDLIDFIF